MIIRKCVGCGAILQNTNELIAGYVPEDLSINNDVNFCRRCYRLIHYNELPKIVASNKDYEKVIDECVKKNGLVVLIVDLFDFQGTFTNAIINKLRNKNVILVANKYDVFPHSTKPERIVDWISKNCEKLFFKVDAIHLVSAKKGYFLDELMRNIDSLRNSRDVYFVGCANVGKSSLINALLKRFTSKTNDVIATSVIPGTTLDQIVIPFFDDNKAFIDTPGLINDNNVLSKLLPVSFDKILPKLEIKPITFQLKVGNAVFIGGIAVISLIEGDASIVCYFSNNLILHRTKAEKIDYFLENHLGGLLNPPTTLELPLKYDSEIYKFSNTKKRDIVFSGLGFISVVGNAEIKVQYISHTGVNVRDAIIGGKIISSN